MKRGILIVDDEERQRNTIKLGLGDEDYVFYEASSVRQALNILNNRQDIEVIILDLDLRAGGLGLTILEQIKTRFPNYRIIVLTAHEELLNAKKAEELHVFYYQPKGAALFVQPLRFAVQQAFKDIERDLLRKRIEKLLNIQRKINSNRNINEILSLICESLLELVGGYTCHIRSFDHKKGDFTLAAFKGSSQNIRTIFAKTKVVGEFYSGKVAEIKKPRRFDALQNHQPFIHMKNDLLSKGGLNKEARDYLNKVRSAYVVPIFSSSVDNMVEAVLNISSEKKAYFVNEERRKLIGEFVTQASIAITKDFYKAKKIEVHRDYNRISKMLAEVSKELWGNDILENIYDVVIKRISAIINPEMISIFLFNEKKGLLENVAEYRGSKRIRNVDEVYPPGVSLTGWVYAHGKAIRRPNLEQKLFDRPMEDDRYDPNYGEEYLDNIPSGKVDHYLCVPMRIGRNKIGVIRLINKKSGYYHGGKIESFDNCLLNRGFSQDCETVLRIAASHLAVSIRNAELINKLNWKVDQLQTLTHVARIISSNSDIGIDELLALIVNKTAEVTRAQICMLFLKDEQGNRIVLRQSYGIPELPGAYYRIGEGKTGKVAQTGVPILEGIVEESHRGKYDRKIIRHLQEKYGPDKNIESFMAVPIITEDEPIIRQKKIIGVLKVINRIQDSLPFDKNDLSIFETFASQIGVALAIAERNVALSQLVRGVYHEINNTSGLIPTNIDEIKERLEDLNDNASLPEIMDILDLIDETAIDAIDFAKDLLGFRITEREEADINELVTLAISQLSPTLRRIKNFENISRTTSLLQQPLVCNVYKTPFIHIIRNIVTNAYQAMENRVQGTLAIKSYTDSSGKIAYIRISDTGIGIRKTDINKIFRPNFFRRKGGTGLGLWLVKLFLYRMDGDISVKSRYGRGATFTIRIPIV